MFFAMQNQTSPADVAQSAQAPVINPHSVVEPTLVSRAQRLDRQLRAWIAAHPALAAAAGAVAGAIVTQGVLSFARHRSTAAALDADVEVPASASVPLLASLLAGAASVSRPTRPAAAPAAVPPEDDVVAPRLKAWGRRLVDEAAPARSRLRHARGAAHRASRDVASATQLAYRDTLQQVERSAQQHPAATVAVAAGLGFVLTLFLTRR